MHYPVTLRILSRSQVEELVSPGDVVETVVDTFRALGEGGLRHPAKEPLWTDDSMSNMLLAMPSYLKERQIAGVKWVSMYKDQRPGIPSSCGNLLILSRGETGIPYALMEATAITTMRTAGGHAVAAARYLAKKSSSTLAVIGCGEEGRAGIRGFLEEFPSLTGLNLCDRDRGAMKEAEKEYGGRVRVTLCENARQAVDEAGIVLLATTSRETLVQYDWLPKGCFVAGLYAFHDLDAEASRRADKWVLGNRETDRRHIIEDPLLSHCSLSMEDVYGDLGEIVTGRLPGRENDEEVIVYTHMGMGALDVAVGDLAYRRSVERGIGIEVDLS